MSLPEINIIVILTHPLKSESCFTGSVRDACVNLLQKIKIFGHNHLKKKKNSSINMPK